MSMKISLDSKTRQSITKALLAESVVACTKTSAPDVYAHVIWTGADGARQWEIDQDESVLMPKGTMTIWIFRKNTGNDPWSAEFTVEDVPQKP